MKTGYGERGPLLTSPLIIFYILGLFWLVTTAAAMNMQRHDSSVLVGLELQVIVTSVALASVYTWGRFRPKQLAILSGFYVAAMSMLPSLKYSLLYGSGDALRHLSLMEQIQRTSTVPSFGYYVDFPTFHILHAQYSLLAGIPLIQVQELLTPSLFFLYPLLSFAMVSRVSSSVEIQRLSSFISAILFTGYPWAFYYAAPAMLALLIVVMIYFILVCGGPLTNLIGGRTVVLLLLLALVPLHHYAVAVFVGILTLSWVLKWLAPIGMMRSGTILSVLGKAALLLSILSALWWFFHATVTYAFIAAVLVPENIVLLQPLGAGLGQFPFLTWVQIVMRQYAAKAVLLLLLLPSFAIAIYRQVANRRDSTTTNLTSNVRLIGLVGSWLVILGLVFVSRFGNVQPYRIFMFGLLITIPFCANTLHVLTQSFRTLFGRKGARVMRVALLTGILLLPFVEFFPNDDLRPRVVYNQVNSVYQYEALFFLSRSSNLEVSTDIITIRQATGFFYEGLYGRLLGVYDPTRREALDGLLLHRGTCSSSMLIVFHRPAFAGAYGESPYDALSDQELDALISNAVIGSNVVFTNSQVFVVFCAGSRG